MPSKADRRAVALLPVALVVLAVTAIPATAATCPMMSAAAAPANAGGAVGQDLFATLSETVAELAADPATDWRRVDLLRLREHLVDMSEVMLRSRVVETPRADGLDVVVTGEGRTLAALRAMLPAHAAMTPGDGGRRVALEERADGYRVVLTAADPAGVEKLRGLGFFGWLVSGDHHRHHHRMLVTGAGPHGHGAP